MGKKNQRKGGTRNPVAACAVGESFFFRMKADLAVRGVGV
jgi:hypothetical protein